MVRLLRDWAVSVSGGTSPIRTTFIVYVYLPGPCGRALAAESNKTQTCHLEDGHLMLVPRSSLPAHTRVKHSTVSCDMTLSSKTTFHEVGVSRWVRHLVCVGLIIQEENNGAMWAQAGGKNPWEQCSYMLLHTGGLRARQNRNAPLYCAIY